MADGISVTNWIAIAFFVLGGLVYLLTYVRAAINKSNRDIDRQTIATLRDHDNATTIDRDSWKARALDAEGQLKVLQNTVTAAPAIAQLAAQISSQHLESTRVMESLITKFDRILKTHEKFMKGAPDA